MDDIPIRHLDEILQRGEQLERLAEECMQDLGAVTSSFQHKAAVKKGGGWFGGGGGGGAGRGGSGGASAMTHNAAPALWQQQHSMLSTSAVTNRVTVAKKLSVGAKSSDVRGRHGAAVVTSSAAAVAPASATTVRSPQRNESSETTAVAEQVDYTKYPNLLEEMYTKYDPDSSLRPTIINPGSSWTKSSQAGLLGKPTSSALLSEEQNKEKEAAFDLLDALTRSGALPIEHASLHVVIAATHCFDQSVMDTLVQKNVNPIERVERSTLIMASTLQGLPAAALVQGSQVERLHELTPALVLQQDGL
jgi:hypothetical protein